jgi:hypothetical protein
MLVIGCTVVATSCTSPETERSRGNGAGADVGNRVSRVQLHAGSDPFYKTPDRIGREKHPSLDPARQARAFDEGR